MVLPEAAAPSAMKPGDAVPIAIDPNKIHIFRAAQRTGNDLTRSGLKQYG